MFGGRLFYLMRNLREKAEGTEKRCTTEGTGERAEGTEKRGKKVAQAYYDHCLPCRFAAAQLASYVPRRPSLGCNTLATVQPTTIYHDASLRSAIAATVICDSVFVRKSVQF